MFCTVLTLVCLFVSGRHQLVRGQCPSDSIRIEGDIILSAIMGLRAPNNRLCGEFQLSEIQVASSLIWAVQKLNGPDGGPSYIPGLKLGLDIQDDCGLERRAAKIALDKLVNMSTSDLLTCESNPVDNTTYVGFISTSTSQTAATVADVLRGTNVPLIGAEATAPDLSNKTVYPNFFRVVPSDVKQAKVLLETLKQLKWSYVALVYTDDKYGRDGSELFKKLALVDEKVCVRYELKISPLDTERDILTSLTTKLTKTRHGRLGVVYIGQLSHAKLLLTTQYEGANQFSDLNSLFWLMSEAVGTSHLDIKRKQTGGVITIALPSLPVAEFKTYFLDRVDEVLRGIMDDPLSRLYKEYVEKMYDCNIHVNSNAPKRCQLTRDYLELNFRQADFVVGALDATYVLATALKEAYKNCQRLCSSRDFKNLIHFVNATNFTYGDIGDMYLPDEFQSRRIRFDSSGDVMADPNSVSYSLHNFWNHEYSLVGEYSNDHLTLNKGGIQFRDPKTGVILSGNDLPKSSCRSSCSQCVLMDDIPFSYVPGDKIIVGLFSLSSRKDGTFECGPFRSNTIAYPTFEAFNYAIAEAKKKIDPTFGGLAFDDCYSPLRAGYIWSKVFSGDYILMHKVTGTIINPDNVVLVIGALSSDVTLQVADILTKLKLPQISYGATTPDLDDREKYPYFLRTVPSDITQVEAIVAVVKELDWSYVGVIYIDNNYGKKGERLFRQKANSVGICIAGESIALSESEDRPNAFKDVVSTLRHHFVKVVVFFGIDTLAKNMLDAFKDLEVDDGEFVFVATEAWGVNDRLLQEGRGDYAKGAIVLHSKTVVLQGYDQFAEYLTKKDPYSCMRCDWLKHYWQDHFQCDLEGTYIGLGTPRPECNERTQRQIEYEDASKFSKDQRVIHTINAVSVGATGIKATISQLCRGQPCGKPFHQIDGWAETAIDNIAKTTMTSLDAGNLRLFKENGNGNIGFVIYNIQQHPELFHLDYNQVGRYENGKLDMNPEKLEFYDDLGKPLNYKRVEAVCGLPGHCDECRIQIDPTTAPITDSTTAPNPDALEATPYKTPLIAIAVVGFVAVAVLFIVLCWCLRRSKQRYRNLRNQKNEPVYAELNSPPTGSTVVLPVQDTPMNTGLTNPGMRDSAGIYSEANPHWSTGQNCVDIISDDGVVINPNTLQITVPSSGSSGESGVSSLVQQCHCNNCAPYTALSERGNVVLCRRCNHLVPAIRETSD